MDSNNVTTLPTPCNFLLTTHARQGKSTPMKTSLWVTTAAVHAGDKFIAFFGELIYFGFIELLFEFVLYVNAIYVFR